MITTKNYTEKIKAVDVSKLDDKFKAGHEYTVDYLELYNDDDVIKKTIDIYLEELNKFIGSEISTKKTAPAAKKPVGRGEENVAFKTKAAPVPAAPKAAKYNQKDYVSYRNSRFQVASGERKSGKWVYDIAGKSRLLYDVSEDELNKVPAPKVKDKPVSVRKSIAAAPKAAPKVNEIEKGLVGAPTGMTESKSGGRVGAKYEEARNWDITKIAKAVKAELQKRWPTVKWSVKSERFSMGRAIRIETSSYPINPYSGTFTQLINEGVSPRNANERVGGSSGRYNQTYIDFEKAVNAIPNQYRYDNSDPMTDYSSTNFYATVYLDMLSWDKKVREGKLPVLVTAKPKPKFKTSIVELEYEIEQAKKKVHDGQYTVVTVSELGYGFHFEPKGSVEVGDIITREDGTVQRIEAIVSEEFDSKYAEYIGGGNYIQVKKKPASNKPIDTLVTSAGGAHVISDRNRIEHGDYKTIAHVSVKEGIKWFFPMAEKDQEVQKEAQALLARLKAEDKVVWETEVTDQLSKIVGCSYGDATGMMMAAPNVLEDQWKSGATPRYAAQMIDVATNAEPKAPKLVPSMQPYSGIYKNLLKIFPDLDLITESDVYDGQIYVKKKIEGYDKFSAEISMVQSNGRLVLDMSHTFVQEGDLMSAPRMQVSVDNEMKIAEAINYESHNTNPQTYKQVYDGNGGVNLSEKKSQNKFLKDWTRNLINQGFTGLYLTEPDTSKQETELAAKDLADELVDDIDRKYKLGDKYRADFDADGMFDSILTVNKKTSISTLELLYDSAVDNNYHIVAGILTRLLDVKREINAGTNGLDQKQRLNDALGELTYEANSGRFGEDYADKILLGGDKDSSNGSDKVEHEVAAQLELLAKMANEAKAKGEDAPDYNLCDISVPGTNIFCQGNKGVARENMPQLKGRVIKGSEAEKLAEKQGDPDYKGQVDAEEAFMKHLKKKGIAMDSKTVPAENLKSTQSELVGTKVAGMTEALKADPKHKHITAPIFISKDGYVLDGHHRWAAHVGLGFNTCNPVTMKVIEVDMDINQLLKETNKFADDFGIAQNAGSVNEEVGSSKDEWAIHKHHLRNEWSITKGGSYMARADNKENAEILLKALGGPYGDTESAYDKVKMESITITGAEGYAEVVEKYPIEFTSWKAASEEMKRLMDLMGGYNKVWVTVKWNDGEDYSDIIDVSMKENNPFLTDNVIGNHIFGSLTYTATNDKALGNPDDEKAFLAEYDLGPITEGLTYADTLEKKIMAAKAIQNNADEVISNARHDDKPTDLVIAYSKREDSYDLNATLAGKYKKGDYASFYGTDGLKVVEVFPLAEKAPDKKSASKLLAETGTNASNAIEAMEVATEIADLEARDKQNFLNANDIKRLSDLKAYHSKLLSNQNKKLFPPELQELMDANPNVVVVNADVKPKAKFKKGDKISLIDTSKEPVYQRTNLGEVTSSQFVEFDNGKKKKYLYDVVSDQDLGRIKHWEDNMVLANKPDDKSKRLRLAQAKAKALKLKYKF